MLVVVVLISLLTPEIESGYPPACLVATGGMHLASLALGKEFLYVSIGGRPDGVEGRTQTDYRLICCGAMPGRSAHADAHSPDTRQGSRITQSKVHPGDRDSDPKGIIAHDKGLP